jgi:hypothetical protein
MRIPLTVKCIAYLCLAALLLVLAVLFARGFAVPPGMGGEQADIRLGEAHRRATLYLFAAGCTLLGAAVYGWMAYIKRHREHKADALFWLITGLLTLAYSVSAFLSFRLGDAAAVDVMRVMLRLLPLPFALRGLALALRRDMPEKVRLPLRIAGGVVSLVLLVLLPPPIFNVLVYY